MTTATLRPARVRGTVPLRVLVEREREEVGGFSEPSKMPWLAWSIPAEMCQTGGRLRKVPGSVCSNCYARKGGYVWPDAKRAMERRFALLADLRAFRRLMVRAIAARYLKLSPEDRKRKAFFRAHDSGDFQSPEHVLAWVWIARKLPLVRFWIPTREYGFVAAALGRVGKFPPNLVIRLSAHMIDGKAPVGFGLPVSTVHTDPDVYADAYLCPAYENGGKCGDCRACWSPRVAHVSYPKH